MRIDRQHQKILACIVALVALPFGAAFGAGGEVHLDQAMNDVSNKASLQRGAKNFVNYCLGCHTAKYARYNRVAADIGLTEEQMIENLMFTGDSPHATMINGINPDDARRWFGVVPPDLSLITRSKGTDYVYTFLKSFYVDPGKATGVNNLALPGTAMPHVLWQLQGTQEAVWEGHTDAQGNAQKHFKEFTWRAGQAQPRGVRRVRARHRQLPRLPRRAGAGEAPVARLLVIAFLVFFTLLAYALKKEYWKDVK
jgi:ubiquinol-cytochrome c reductase cytochrome c1 subunit